MPQVKYMIPIWFRRMALQALADGVDPEGRVDILGQDVAIDDATAELNPDFSAWIATFSPSQSEIAMLVRNKRIPDSPGFWDKVWGGIVGTFKEVLSLDFLVNVATMGYADLTTGSNKASKAVTDQIKDKFGASEVLGWVGSGIDSSSGVTKMAPNPKPMTPEEKRIATWLASQYVTVPDPMVGPGAQDQRPWILRLDLALCGLWPILDVVQWMGGVEGLERSLIFATAPNGEMVIGGSRDLYQKPGQLVLRAMVVARRSLAGIEDRYTYGAASLLSMRQNRPDAAPTRTWFDWAANEDLKTGPLKEVWSYEGRKNNGETVRVQGDRTGAPAQNDAAAISYLDAQDQRSQGKAKLEGVKFVNIPSLPMIPAGPGTLAWLRSMTVGENGRVNSTAIATTFALGSLDDRTKSYVPRAYTKWSIAGPVPFTGKTWVSDANVDQMALEGDTETMSLTPQGRDKMKAAGG